MKEFYLFLLTFLVSMLFTSTNALAYSYNKVDIPEYSLYFAEPDDTEYSFTEIDDLMAGDDLMFDVWISDVPTGKQGLWRFHFDIQYDPQAMTYHEDEGFTALGAFLVNDPWAIYGKKSLPEGWDAHGFAGFQFAGPGLDGNVPLVRLTFHCEESGSPTLIPTWHWGDDEDFETFDNYKYGHPDTGEPGFQGIGESQPLYAISGTVTMHGDGDAAGIAVTMTGSAARETVTDQDGKYVFDDLDNGTYTITPKEPVFGFDPGAETVEIASADEIADFDMYELLGDVNGDSRLDLADTMAGLKILCDVDLDPEVVVYPEASPNDKIGLPEATNVLQAVADLRPFPPTE